MAEEEFVDGAFYCPEHEIQATMDSSVSHIRYICYRFVLPIIAAIGVTGNSISLAMLTKLPASSYMRKSDGLAHRLLTALAISDLALCALVLPVAGVADPSPRYLGDSPTHPLLLYERLSPFAISSLMLLSTWLIVALALDRYHKIVPASPCAIPPSLRRRFHPVTAHRLLLGTMCVASVLFNVPLLFRTRIEQCGVEAGFAVVARPESDWDRAHWIAWALVGNIVPLAILLWTSGCMVVRVRRLTRATWEERYRLKQIQDRLRLLSCYNVRTVRYRVTPDAVTPLAAGDHAAAALDWALVRCEPFVTHSPAVRETDNLRAEFNLLLRRFEQRRRVNSKLTNTLACIVVAFLLLVSPSDVTKLVLRLLEATEQAALEQSTPLNESAFNTTEVAVREDELWLLLETFFNITQVLNSAVNFLIYYFANSVFRALCVQSWHSVLAALRSCSCLPFCANATKQPAALVVRTDPNNDHTWWTVHYTNRVRRESQLDAVNGGNLQREREVCAISEVRRCRLPPRMEKNLLIHVDLSGSSGTKTSPGQAADTHGANASSAEPAGARWLNALHMAAPRRRDDRCSTSLSADALASPPLLANQSFGSSHVVCQRCCPRPNHSLTLPTLPALPQTAFTDQAKLIHVCSQPTVAEAKPYQLPTRKSTMIDIYRYLE